MESVARIVIRPRPKDGLRKQASRVFVSFIFRVLVIAGDRLVPTDNITRLSAHHGLTNLSPGDVFMQSPGLWGKTVCEK